MPSSALGGCTGQAASGRAEPLSSRVVLSLDVLLLSLREPLFVAGFTDVPRLEMCRDFASTWRDVLPESVMRRKHLQESERLELPAPFSRRIAGALDAYAAGQATLYCCFDKIGREEGERDRHIDLPGAALLARAKFCDRGYPT
jgi:hypothetical protein